MATENSEAPSVQEKSKAILLLIIAEPVFIIQKNPIISEIEKGIKSWDEELSGCNICTELEKAYTNFTISDEGVNGERILSYSSEVVSIEVLVNPTLKLLQFKLKQFFIKEGNYRHLIYAGLSVKFARKWMLQDAFFHLSYFTDIFQSSEVSNAIKQNIVRGHVYLNSYADNQLLDVKLSKESGLKFKLNAKPVKDCSGYENFIKYISQYIVVEEMKDLLKVSSVIGNIRFNRPTIYIFPACQGDSALFGVSGFNLLIDGGYNKKSCFWDYVRHLDRLDAILISHLTLDNYFGINSLILKKGREGIHQEIGCVFVNGIKEAGKFIESGKNSHVDVESIPKASTLIETMKLMNIILKPCFSNNMQPINLYHKVGHGSLDLFVLNPSQDSRYFNEFLTMWGNNTDPFVSKTGLPLSDLISICAVLVWKPASPHDTITRLLFPGSVTQSILFEGLEKMKNLSVFHFPQCSEKDINPTKPVKKSVSKISQKPDLSSPKSDHSNKAKKTWPAKKESSKNNLNKDTKKDDNTKSTEEQKSKDDLIEDSAVKDEKSQDKEPNIEIQSVPMPQKEENSLTEPVTQSPEANNSEESAKENKFIGDGGPTETSVEGKDPSRQDSLENVAADASECVDAENEKNDADKLDMNKVQQGLTEEPNSFASISESHEANSQQIEKDVQQIRLKDESSQEPDTCEDVKSWDKPLGAPPPVKVGHKPNTPAGARKTASSHRIVNNSSRQGASKFGQKMGNVIYLDLAYLPQHADPHCIDVEFFKRVRARYYVLSTVCPDAGVLTSLLEGKQSWEDPNLEVTIIPTYDTEVLRYWMAAHQDQLSHLRVNVAPAANRCTIQLQDHETCCAAYRLEF